MGGLVEPGDYYSNGRHPRKLGNPELLHRASRNMRQVNLPPYICGYFAVQGEVTQRARRCALLTRPRTQLAQRKGRGEKREVGV